MPLVDVVDETFVVAAPGVLARRLADPVLWRHWWPRLTLTVFMDRGLEGLRWSVTGELVGSAEVWLEPHADGVIVHFYLRADPTVPGSEVEPPTTVTPRRRRRAARLAESYRLEVKQRVNALKDELEAGRPPGTGRS